MSFYSTNGTVVICCLILFNLKALAQIPLPEHPRPDFERPQWQNLNGSWAFAFDGENEGLEAGWSSGEAVFDEVIQVPFPWGSKLSGIEDKEGIGWYQREIRVNESWRGQRIFLTIGAADWETTVWLDGKLLGSHQGGYVPFSFELTEVRFGQTQQLVIRVDDARRDFTLYGKQGYGNARGIWQTIYLEARGQKFLEALHFTPDIDHNKLKVTAYLPESSGEELTLDLHIKTEGDPIQYQTRISAVDYKRTFEIPIPNAHLWSLDDPYLYEVKATLEGDTVHSYFGMRKISVMDLPGTDFPYIALNNQPIYLQLALDQSYHPDGYYTFPSDQFIKEEILRSKSIGLNGIRTHIKVEVPRKLYWADKLGLLVMEDLPNSWGEPDKYMQMESEYTLREMIKRDYNHPSIFSWVIFNETWGLYTQVGTNENNEPIREYLPQTQQWVASMYYLAKSLDGSRLVEDNSICCGRGHTETDINSWHVYLPGYKWESYLKELTENTYQGSTHDFEAGFKQGRQPNINSECGNVWGYEGSAGDVDWSWDYHRMINAFRKYPQVGGWLYTEHHDVINEWNGYWRFDRTEKHTGLEDIVPEMSLSDLHSTIYISTGQDICYTAQAGAELEIPLFISSMDPREFQDDLVLEFGEMFTNEVGETTEYEVLEERKLDYKPWMQGPIEPLVLQAPDNNGLATIRIILKTSSGEVLHRNFVHLVINGGQQLEKTKVVSVAARDYSFGQWSKKTWDAMEGKKVNGAGNGYFEYDIAVNKSHLDNAREVFFVVEAGAKELFVKDQGKKDTDKGMGFMLGEKVEPSANPNAYPMTDETTFPSEIKVYINDKLVKETVLPDDPADHRGVLSWFSQLQDSKLREAGSYGYLVKVPLEGNTLADVKSQGFLKVRLESVNGGGLAIYGKNFGRYPLGPSLVIKE